MNKFLGVALIAAIASYASVDAKYVPGFKLGAEFGVSFNKYKVDGVYAENGHVGMGPVTSIKGSKNKTSFEGALKAGYEFLVCDSVIAGADLSFGYNFAGKAKLYETANAKKAVDSNYMQIKKKFEIEFAPKIGFKMTDEFVGFVKVVANMSNYKMKVYDNNDKAVDNGFSKSKTKFAFGIGADLEYHFDNCLAATFGYTYLFKTKLLKANTEAGSQTPKYTNAAHKIALGLKYTFA